MNNKIYKETISWIIKYQFQIFGSLSFKVTHKSIN